MQNSRLEPRSSFWGGLSRIIGEFRLSRGKLMLRSGQAEFVNPRTRTRADRIMHAPKCGVKFFLVYAGLDPIVEPVLDKRAHAGDSQHHGIGQL